MEKFKPLPGFTELGRWSNSMPISPRCKLCQDVPGKDGLGRPCKGCEGTGVTETTIVAETHVVAVHRTSGNVVLARQDLEGHAGVCQGEISFVLTRKGAEELRKALNALHDKQQG